MIKIKMRDRLYLSMAKNIRSLSLYNQTLFNLLISSGLGDRLSNRLSVIAAAIQLEKSYNNVPAYRGFAGVTVIETINNLFKYQHLDDQLLHHPNIFRTLVQ